MKALPTRTLLGLILLAIGVIFLLDRLNLISVTGLFSYAFPLLIIALGVVSYLSNPKAFVVPAVLVVFGLLLLLSALSVIAINVWQLIVPLIVIAIGLSLLIKRPSGVRREQSLDTIDATAIFSGLELHNNSQQFQGGVVTAVFGGTEVDLRKCDFQGEAALEVFVAFGGVALKVPEHWNVHFSGLPLFGGMEDKTEKTGGQDAPLLTIKGTCLFGGVEIKN